MSQLYPCFYKVVNPSFLKSSPRIWGMGRFLLEHFMFFQYSRVCTFCVWDRIVILPVGFLS